MRTHPDQILSWLKNFLIPVSLAVAVFLPALTKADQLCESLLLAPNHPNSITPMTHQILEPRNLLGRKILNFDRPDREALLAVGSYDLVFTRQSTDLETHRRIWNLLNPGGYLLLLKPRLEIVKHLGEFRLLEKREDSILLQKP